MGNYQTSPNYSYYYHHVRNHISLARVGPILSLSHAPSNATYSAWFAFFLPSYATFKTLSNRPISESELQQWAMYWSVIGAFVAFEYVAEWFITWYAVFSTSYLEKWYLILLKRIPFYWEVKTLFLLFLSLPQTQVSRLVLFSLSFSFRVSGLDIHLHFISSTTFLAK